MKVDIQSKVTLVFPMAGQGSRFQYKFKPFLQFCGKTFIENAVEPFIKHKSKIERVVFIFTQEQEKDNAVSAFLTETFGNIFKVDCVILPKQTDNQYQTVSQGLLNSKVSGEIIVCDCDHRLNVDCFFRGDLVSKSECVVPVWKIDLDEVKHWSVIGLNRNMQPISIAEKSVPPEGETYFGCIGCTYFRNASSMLDVDDDTTAVSQVIRKMIEKRCVRIVEIYEGYFFGDQEKLNNLEEERESLLLSAENVFDLEGGSLAKTSIVKLSGGKMVVRKSANKNFKIDLGYTKLKQQYNRMRFLYKLMPQNVAQPIHEFENDEVYFYDLDYLAGYKELHKFKKEEISTCLDKVLKTLNDNCYSGVNRVSLPTDNSWLENHLEIKVTPKLEQVSRIGNPFNSIVNGDIFYVNGYSCYGLRHSLEMIKKYHDLLRPRFLSAVHGDLTFSNIMYNEEDFYIIDSDGADQFDNPMLDFGKLCQSILGRYEKWCNEDIAVIENSSYDFEAPTIRTYKELESLSGLTEYWSAILNVSDTELKPMAYFYCGLHFIRMIPFRLEVGREQALYALILAGFYLSKAFDKLERE